MHYMEHGSGVQDEARQYSDALQHAARELGQTLIDKPGKYERQKDALDWLLLAMRSASAFASTVGKCVVPGCNGDLEFELRRENGQMVTYIVCQKNPAHEARL